LFQGFTFVEMLIRYRFAKRYGELLVFVAEGFVGQVKHFQVPFHPEKSTEIGQTIKET
jgi:imidazoleglycerol phosphate synthase glutamine amidotransferase subunit HisH